MSVGALPVLCHRPVLQDGTETGRIVQVTLDSDVCIECAHFLFRWTLRGGPRRCAEGLYQAGKCAACVNDVAEARRSTLDEP